MKKASFTALIITCLFAAQVLNAQQNTKIVERDALGIERPKYEIRVGYGILSDMQLMAAFSDTYVTMASGITGEPISSEYPTVGPINASFNFFLWERITLGPEFNIMQLDIKNTYSSGEITRDHFLITNLSARIDFYYVKNEKIELYSGASLGGSYIFEQSVDPDEEDNSAPFVSYHLNFFGIRFGKSWAGYAEVGFGRNGLTNFGISKRL